VTVDSTTVTPGGSVTFDGTASSDADGTITSYDWTFGDGTTASGSTVSHAYDRPGSYDATLTVTDDDGATATDSVTIDVSDETPETTEVTVEHLSDGDTLDVTMPDGTAESIRVLGIDTPELPGNSDAERPPEWEGIDSYEYLGRWGERASEFAKQAFEVGDTVEIYFDDVADRRDPFDRLLAYVRYDATGDGSRDTLYNRKIIEEGYARVYGSGLAKHDGFRNAEEAARTSNRGVWENADPGTVSELRDSAVEELFVPKARAVTTGASAIDSDRIPVTDADGDNALVGVDESTNVAMVGGLLIDETYESEEGFPVDTADYGNFPFLTNLLDALGTTTSGPVLIDGGHGQFGSDAALSSEDAAYYQRYLEGQGIDFQQRNDLATADLASARAIIVTTPVSSFTTDEVNALTEFLEAGGAVVLIGASNGDPTALNDLASALGTDLRLGDAVTDYSSNLDDDETVPVTARFDSTFDLFGPHS
jgi:endonuclease YncB( thermonuclease family)